MDGIMDFCRKNDCLMDHCFRRLLTEIPWHRFLTVAMAVARVFCIRHWSVVVYLVMLWLAHCYASPTEINSSNTLCIMYIMYGGYAMPAPIVQSVTGKCMFCTRRHHRWWRWFWRWWFGQSPFSAISSAFCLCARDSMTLRLTLNVTSLTTTLIGWIGFCHTGCISLCIA